MIKVRTYAAVMFLLIFGCYFSSINLFPHVHIVNGNSIVHSHFGGDSDHGHSTAEYRVIDLLSSFQTEAADLTGVSVEPFFLSDDERCSFNVSQYVKAGDYPAYVLRGPPQV